MNKKSLEVIRICNKCGEINTINELNLKRKNVYDEFGKYYRIIYYKCKRCNEVNVVQIDDYETMKVFKKFKDLTIKVAKKNIKNETISPKDIKKKDKLIKDLSVRRTELEAVTNGIKLYDENKNIFIECLTIKKVGDIIESNL